jgi:hypothetical protein
MNIKKTIVILFILILSLSILSVVFASEDENDNFNIESFEGKGNVPDEVSNLTQNGIGAVIGIIRIVASGGLIISLIFISIKYMVSSAGDRADIKKHAIAFVVAALIIFGSTFIIEILIKLSEEIKVQGS